MVSAGNPRKHSNLYYILEADKREHPMPSEQVKILREKIFENFSKT